MREYGIPKVLTWRWTPFAALVLGSLSFAGFAMLVIPDRIGHVDVESSAATLRLGNGFASTQPGSAPAANWSSSSNDNDNDNTTGSGTASPVSRVATRGPDSFPRRGFSPPLERPEPQTVPVLPPPNPPQLIPPPAVETPPPAPPVPAEAPPPPAADPAPAPEPAPAATPQ